MLDWNKGKGEVFVTGGVGHGMTGLAAFDNAELDAGLIAVNAIEVTSFIPPGWKISSDKKALMAKTQNARFIPMVFKYATSKVKPVSAAVAIGIPQDKKKPCVIMEYSSDEMSEREIERMAIASVEEVFGFREWEIDNIISRAVENRPKKDIHACALVAVAYFPEEFQRE